MTCTLVVERRASVGILNHPAADPQSLRENFPLVNLEKVLV